MSNVEHTEPFKSDTISLKIIHQHMSLNIELLSDEVLKRALDETSDIDNDPLPNPDDALFPSKTSLDDDRRYTRHVHRAAI